MSNIAAIERIPVKLITYRVDGRVHLGKTDGMKITMLDDVLADPDKSMTALITGWEQLSEKVAHTSGHDHDLHDVELLAPVPRPGKIFGLGMNYADHVAEAN